jgi:signal peptidase II
MSRRSPVNFLSIGALACFVLTAVVGFCLDQWSKVAAFRELSGGMVPSADGREVPANPQSVHFIPGWLHFDVTANPGAVFGIGAGQRVLFITVSLAAIVFIFYLFATSGRQRGYQIILGMLLAGVLGNLYDRLVFGYVRDMIHALPRWPGVFPWIFNVADSLLCVGVFLMIVYSFFHDPQRAKEPQTA